MDTGLPKAPKITNVTLEYVVDDVTQRIVFSEVDEVSIDTVSHRVPIWPGDADYDPALYNIQQFRQTGCTYTLVIRTPGTSRVDA